MNQHNTNKFLKIILNNIILSVMLTILLIVTGIMPLLIKFVVSWVNRDVGSVIDYGFGALGMAIGFWVSVLGLLIGLTPIIVPVAIVYFLLKKPDSDEI